MRTAGRTPLLAAAASLAFAACSAPPPSAASSRSAEAAPDAPAPAAPSLHGRWRILEVDGRPPQTMGAAPRAQPEVAFGPGAYGGSSGCNSFGGHGLLVGDRWFADAPMATQMACGPLDAQESAIVQVLSGGPTLAWQGADVAILRTPAHSLRLGRSGPAPERGPADPSPLIAGSRWEIHALDGRPIDLAGARQPARLTLEADRWTLETRCETRSGPWRQADGAVVIEPGRAERRACPAGAAAAGAALAEALQGRLGYVVGFNGELVLAGESRWAVGRRDVTLERDTPDLLSGQWRVTSVDGAPPPASERPAELAFGPGGFAVWDGCRHSEGVAIVAGRRLFAHGSGVVTAAVCPADPIRAKINDVVGSRPRVAITADGGRALVSRAGTLRLVRTSARPFGVGAETRLRSGRVFDLMTGETGPARLTLGPGDRFSLSFPCGTVQGRWRTDRGPAGPYARFGPDRPAPGCDADPLGQRLFGFFSGDVQAAIGPNGDIALFVSNGDAIPARPVRSPGS